MTDDPTGRGIRAGRSHRPDDELADRVAEHLARFGSHLVDGLEAVRNLTVAAIEDLGYAVRRDLEANTRALERSLELIQVQLASASEIGVAEAEHLAALATAVRDVGQEDGRGASEKLVREVSGVRTAFDGLRDSVREVSAVRVACDSLRDSVNDLHAELTLLRDELEELRQELGADTPVLAPEADQELSRLATEVRLLRRRMQLQASARATAGANALNPEPPGRGP